MAIAGYIQDGVRTVLIFAAIFSTNVAGKLFMNSR
jgi:hypothetical protein